MSFGHRFKSFRIWLQRATGEKFTLDLDDEVLIRCDLQRQGRFDFALNLDGQITGRGVQVRSDLVIYSALADAMPGSPPVGAGEFDPPLPEVYVERINMLRASVRGQVAKLDDDRYWPLGTHCLCANSYEEFACWLLDSMLAAWIAFEELNKIKLLDRYIDSCVKSRDHLGGPPRLLKVVWAYRSH